MTALYQLASSAIQGMRKYQEDSCQFVVLNERPLVVSETRIQETSETRIREDETAQRWSNGYEEIVAVMADGMGGHVGGAQASKAVCEGFIEAYSKAGNGAVRRRLESSFQASNLAIAREIERNSSLNGMGSTLVGVTLNEEGLRWVSIGDSLLYLFRNGQLIHLNEDHSFAPVLDQLVAEGKLTTREALDHPKRQALRSALTGSDTSLPLVDLHDEPLSLHPDDWIIIASDGIETLSPREIESIIRASYSQGADIIVDALIMAIEQVGDPYQDNTTIMAIGHVQELEEE